MKTKLTKKEVEEKIISFFNKRDFTPKELKKIKRLAMKFNIKLTPYKRLFCKACLNPLAGKIRISKEYKIVECKSCKTKNKVRIK